MSDIQRKILGIVTGRKGGNTELLLRHALKACKEDGCEVEMIRLTDFNIKPCTGCLACVLRPSAGLPRKCVQKDDGEFVLEKILHCDGLILSVPNMDLMPHAPIINLCNRSFVINERARYLREPGTEPEYPKVAATIGLGGSDWTQFHMPILNLCAIWLTGARNMLVDQMMVQHFETTGLVSLFEEYTTRAEQLGHHVCQELGKDEGEFTYHGSDVPEACPICHCDALILREGKLVCPLCNVAGIPIMENGKIRSISWEAGVERSHWSKFGKLDHDVNTDWYIRRDEQGKKIYENHELERIKEQRELLKDVVTPTLPPSKAAERKE